jgi:hypothetical protein
VVKKYKEKDISPQRHGDHGEVKFLICREMAGDQKNNPLRGKLQID